MKKIICDLYARVSTVEQATEGYSIGEQEERLRAFASAQGWEVNACYLDGGFSGAKLARPGMQAVIRDCEAHKVSKVVTYKLDRLSRSQKDTLYLIEDVFLQNGVDYVSMTESLDTGTPFGMAMIGILSVFAQLEREQIKERMMLGRVASAKEGNWRGGAGAPTGYRYVSGDKVLTVEPYEAQIVKRIFDLFLRGKSYNAIMTDISKTFGRTFSGSAVIADILQNRVYIGDIKYQNQWYKGRHEPIIDADTFERAQARIAEYSAELDAHRRRPYEAKHLLTGLLFCGDCGARWCYHVARPKGKPYIYETYMCYTKNAHKTMRRADRCSVKPWKAAELEALIESQVRALAFEEITPVLDSDAVQIEALVSRIEALDGQTRRLIDLYALGSLPFDAIETRSKELTEERDRLTAQVEALQSRRAKLSDAELRDALSRVADVFDNGTVQDKRDLLTLLIKRIVLMPDREVRIEWNI